MRADDTNDERITARVPLKVKERLEQAAELSGARSLNQFIVNAALKEAEVIIQREQMIHLDESSTKTFFALLENPPVPNERLKAAIKRYEKTDLHANRAPERKA